MHTTWQDLRHGARTLWNNPGFSLVAALTLALGIGANTAIFSIVNAVLLRPLPFAESSRLVILDESSPAQAPGRGIGVSYPNFLDWRGARSFDSLTAYWPDRVVFAGSEGAGMASVSEPIRVAASFVSADFFKVMRAMPTQGRAFITEDDVPEAPPVVVVSAGFAERHLMGPNQAIGRTLSIGGRSRTVVGVAPRTFGFPEEETELWMPLGPSANQPALKNRAVHILGVVARLKGDVTLKQATTEMASIMGRIQRDDPGADPGHAESVATLQDAVVGDVQPALLVLLGAVGFVLLIACVNVANLLLARASSRQKEIAVRAALGASRERVVRQFLTESLLLSFIGGSLGLAFAFFGHSLLVDQISAVVPRAKEIAIDGSVLAFTALVALITGLLFGAAPAAQASRADLNLTLKEGSCKSTGMGWRGIRGALVVAEVALSLVLLVGAGLLMKSFWRLQQVDPGFRAENVMTIAMSLPEAGYREGTRATDFYSALPARLTSLPGVLAVSAVSSLPISGGDGEGNVTIDGRPFTRGEEPAASFRRNLPNYFQVMGIPLEQGREFDARDNGTDKVVIINAAFARRFWPQGGAVGARIKVGPPENEPWLRVVGVVRDVHNVGLDANPSFATYEPLAQRPRLSMSLVVRTVSDPIPLIASVRSAIRGADKNILVSETSTLDQRLERSTVPRRFNLFLLSLFAAVALLLAVVGIYGVMAYALTQRTQEIGIRMALGAQPIDVLRQIAGEGLSLILAGIALGLLGAIALSRALSTMLFGVSATDPATFVSIALLLATVGLVACCLPARRATRLNPILALRRD